jgi:hypothetical protein
MPPIAAAFNAPQNYAFGWTNYERTTGLQLATVLAVA